MKNKNLKISRIDFIILLITFIFSLFNIFSYTQLYKNQRELNISKVEYDFLITIPSEEQVNEIESLSSTNKIVPYYYFEIGDDYFNTLNFYIIDSLNEASTTMFANSLLIEKNNEQYNNSIFIDEKAAKSYKLSLNDKITFTIGQTQIEYIVSAIYKSDGRGMNGNVIAGNEGTTKKFIDSRYNGIKKYKGAFIDSNNHQATKEYLLSYCGYGNLKDKSEFETEEEYLAYFNENKPTYASPDTIDIKQLIEQKNILFKDQIKTNKLLCLMCTLGSAIILIIFLIFKQNRYISKNFAIDFNANYTKKAEKNMFIRYNLKWLVLIIIQYVIFLLSGLIFKKLNYFEIYYYLYTPYFWLTIIFYLISIIVSSIIFVKKVSLLYSNKKN